MTRTAVGHRKRKSSHRGDGILDSAKSLYKKAKHVVTAPKRFFEGQAKKANPQVRDKLDQIGGLKVVGLQAGRTPLSTVLQRGFDLVSLGNWSKVKKKLGYDDVFHVYLIATLENGQRVKLEKNATVELTDYKPGKKDELLPIDLDKTRSLKEYLGNAEKAYGKELYKYHPQDSNCQDFATAIIKTNSDAVDHDQQVETFINQDKKALNDSLGFAKKLPAVITDARARLEHAVRGSGVRCPCGTAHRDLIHFRRLKNKENQWMVG